MAGTAPAMRSIVVRAMPVDLALAQARIDRGPDDLVAPATDRVLLGGPAGQHLPGPADRQLRHASRATLLQHVLQQGSVPDHRARLAVGASR
jgi:hypothetical protein